MASFTFISMPNFCSWIQGGRGEESFHRNVVSLCPSLQIFFQPLQTQINYLFQMFALGKNVRLEKSLQVSVSQVFLLKYRHFRFLLKPKTFSVLNKKNLKLSLISHYYLTIYRSMCRNMTGRKQSYILNIFLLEALQD